MLQNPKEDHLASAASSCSCKLSRNCFAILAEAVNNCTSDLSAIANAHAVMARFCPSKSLMRHSAALAKAVNS